MRIISNTRVFGLCYASGSDLVRNDKSKTCCPWRSISIDSDSTYSASWFGCTAAYGERSVNKVALTRFGFGS